MQIHSTSPDCLLRFFVYKEDDSFFASRGTKVTQSEIVDCNVVDVQADIISVETSKSKGSPGNFGIVLSSVQNWNAVITAGSWVMIYMSNKKIDPKRSLSDLDSGLKMIGVVRSVRRVENLDPNTGTRVVRYIISGEDFQSLFHSPIYLNQVFGNSSTPGLYELFALTQENLQGAPPSKVISVLSTALLGSFRNVDQKGKLTSIVSGLGRGFQPYIVPSKLMTEVVGQQKRKTNLFTDLVTFFLQDNLLGKLAHATLPTSTVDTWSIIKSYSHALLNELYTELLPAQVDDGSIRLVPSLVFRAIPFSSGYGQKTHQSAITMNDATDVFLGDQKFLPVRINGVARSSVIPSKKKKKPPLPTGAHFFTSKIISEDEIMGYSSGRTHGELFNIFILYPTIPGGQTQTLSPEQLFRDSVLGNGRDYLDPISIGRFGSRPFISDSQYVFFSSQEQIQLNKLVRDLWFRAHLFENGQVQLIGSNSFIPVGTNLEFLQRRTIAHIEKADNLFSVASSGNKHFSTTLTFVRLQKKMTSSNRNKFLKSFSGGKYIFPMPYNSTDNNIDNTSGRQFDDDRGISFTNQDPVKPTIGGFPPSSNGGNIA